MKNKILLSSVYTLDEDPWERKQMKPYPPLGILYVASYLKHHGFRNDTIRLFDATFSPGTEKFTKMIENFKPDILGITTNTITEKKAIKMAKITKEYLDIPVIVGGPGPSMNPKPYLEEYCDAAVLGEGEETAIEVFNYFLSRNTTELKEIQGIAYQYKTEIIKTSPRKMINDLDTISFPDRDLLIMEDYKEVWVRNHGIFYSSLITARGCPYSCTWCARDLSFGRKYRHRSVENIIEEIRLLKDVYNVDALRFVDDILTVHRKRSIALFKAMIENDVRIPFECLTRVDRVDKELLSLMKQAGLQLIYYGVESGSQRILDAMNKQISVSNIYQTSKLMKDLKLNQSWFLMLGYPPENFHDIKKTLSLIRELTPEKFGVSIAYPLPKTKFFQDLIDKNLLLINQEQWDQSLDNKLLFRATYSSSFYKWAIRSFYLNAYSSKFKEKHPNIFTKLIDIGAYLSTVKLLELLSKSSSANKEDSKGRKGIGNDEKLEELPVEPIPIQC